MTAAIAPSTFAVATASPIPGKSLLNLLIVDDERSVREACREVASALGYHTTAVESAEQALRAAWRRSYLALGKRHCIES
jgi:PleD family two-component response regulator